MHHNVKVLKLKVKISSQDFKIIAFNRLKSYEKPVNMLYTSACYNAQVAELI